jgi:hypothetical protein
VLQSSLLLEAPFGSARLPFIANPAVSQTPVYPVRLLPKMTPAITNTRRRAVPMPDDHIAQANSDDGNFRNF